MYNLCHFSQSQSPQMLSWLKYQRWSENRDILVPQIATLQETCSVGLICRLYYPGLGWCGERCYNKVFLM